MTFCVRRHYSLHGPWTNNHNGRFQKRAQVLLPVCCRFQMPFHVLFMTKWCRVEIVRDGPKQMGALYSRCACDVCVSLHPRLFMGFLLLAVAADDKLKMNQWKWYDPLSLTHHTNYDRTGTQHAPAMNFSSAKTDCIMRTGERARARYINKYIIFISSIVSFEGQYLHFFLQHAFISDWTWNEQQCFWRKMIN